LRTQTGAVQRYTANNPPDSPAEIASFLRQELARLQDAFNTLADGQLDVTTVAPPKPRDGMLRLADGSSWNPGSGSGFYGYRAGAWRFLG
jgi:hypothetical protein